MKKLIAIILIAGALAGCAKLGNQIAADGGLFGDYTGTYIVRNDSGGRIMDVWILRNVIVQSDEHGAGWLMRDNNGNVIHLSGDVKVVRMKGNNEPPAGYHEYHAEFERKTYQELYCP